MKAQSTLKILALPNSSIKNLKYGELLNAVPELNALLKKKPWATIRRVPAKLLLELCKQELQKRRDQFAADDAFLCSWINTADTHDPGLRLLVTKAGLFTEEELSKTKLAMNLSKEDLISIHNSLHDHNQTLVVVGNTIYNIKVHPDKRYRYVHINGITWAEQWKHKPGSPFAKRAQKGDLITWGVKGVGRGPWAHIESVMKDGKLQEPKIISS